MNHLNIYLTSFFILFFLCTANCQTLQWAHGFGGDTPQGYPGGDYMGAFELAANGDLICAGSVIGSGNLDPAGNSAYAFDTDDCCHAGFLSRFDADGNIIWNRFMFGDPIQHYQAVVDDVAIDNSGAIYVVGEFIQAILFDQTALPDPSNTLITGAATDHFLAKYDSNGNFQWVKHLEGTAGSVGGLVSIEIDHAGNLIVAGSFLGTVDLDPDVTVNYVDCPNGNTNIFLAKYNPNGSLLYAGNIGGSGAETLRNLKILGNQICIVGDFKGSTQLNPATNAISHTSQGGTDGFIAMYNLNGNFIRSFSIGGPDNDGINAVALKFNRLYLGGFFESTADLNPHPSQVTDLTALPNTIYNFITGHDAFLLRCNPVTGALGWVRAVRGSAVQDGYDTDLVRDIVIDAAGDIYFAGQYNGEADFDPGPDTVLLNSNGNIDCFLARWSEGATPSLQWAIPGNGGFLRTSAGTLRLGSNASLFVAGTFEHEMDFAPNSSPLGDLTNTGTAGPDCFLARFDNVNQIAPPGPTSPGAAIPEGQDRSQEPESGPAIEIGPNPIQHTLGIRLKYGLDKDCMVRLYNAVGEMVLSGRIPAGQTSFSLQVGDLPPGTFIVNIDQGNTRIATKILVKQ